MQEVWKSIPGHEFYEASNLGRIRSLDRMIPNGRIGIMLHQGRVLKHGVDKLNRQTVRLGRKAQGFVHKFVMLAFVGPRPKGTEICHGDGNPANNILSNLRYGTSKENSEDMIQHGRSLRGKKNPMARLEEHQVCEIRRLCSNGLSHSSIARQFNLSRTAVTNIANYKRWAWLHD